MLAINYPDAPAPFKAPDRFFDRAKAQVANYNELLRSIETARRHVAEHEAEISALVAREVEEGAPHTDRILELEAAIAKEKAAITSHERRLAPYASAANRAVEDAVVELRRLANEHGQKVFRFQEAVRVEIANLVRHKDAPQWPIREAISAREVVEQAVGGKVPPRPEVPNASTTAAQETALRDVAIASAFHTPG